MAMETIREFIRREPFEPFVIRLSNGEVHEVRAGVAYCAAGRSTVVAAGYISD